MKKQRRTKDAPGEAQKNDPSRKEGARKAAPPTQEQPRDYPDPVDDTLDDTFPASDPPSWWAR